MYNGPQNGENAGKDNGSVETRTGLVESAIEKKTETDQVALYEKNPDNNPLSLEFMSKYQVKYSEFPIERDPGQPSPELSVVIPAHNEGKEMIGLIESLSRQAGKNNAEIVIVINNDTAGTGDSISRAVEAGKIDGSNLRIIECEYPYKTEQNDGKTIGGVGLARKIGMDYAVSIGTKSIASLDADWEIGDEFIASIIEKMGSKVDGFTFQTEGIVDDKSIEYVKYRNQLKKYRELVNREPEKTNNDVRDKNTGAIHVISSAAYAKAGGMVPIITGEDGSFGSNLVASEAKLSKSEIKVGVKLRESETPGGQGASMKEFNEGLVENPDNPNEVIALEEAQKIITENDKFKEMIEAEKEKEEIIEKLIQELKDYYRQNKNKVPVINSETMESVQESLEGWDLLQKHVLATDGLDVGLIQALHESNDENEFVNKLKDSIGKRVRQNIEDSLAQPMG